MKINWNQPVLDFDAKEIRVDKLDADGKPTGDKRPMLVGEQAAAALMQEDPQDKESPDQRFKRADLAHRIHNLTGEAAVRHATRGVKPDDEFTADEIATVNKAVRKYGHPVTMYFISNFLDGKWKPADKADAEDGAANDSVSEKEKVAAA